MPDKLKIYQCTMISFLLGSFALICLSTLQKIVVDAPLILRGYIVPVLFGGLTGALLGYLYRKLVQRNKELERFNNELHAQVRQNTQDLQAKESNLRLQQEALRLKSEEQSLLLDSIPTMIWYLVDPFTFGAVNQAFARYLGLLKTELEYHHLQDVLPRDEAGMALEKNIQSFQQMEPTSSEEWLSDAQGEPRLFVITRTPQLDEEHNVTSVVCEGVDVTELKKAWHALARSEEKYRTIIETTSSGCWQLDAEEITVDVNQALSNILGYAREEIIGCTPFEFVDKENRQIFLENVAKTASKDHRNYDITLIHKNGNSVYAHFDSTTLYDSSGRVSGSFAFVTDITDRIRAEEALRESEEKYRILFQTSPDAMALVDEDGVFLTVNASMASRFHMAREALEGLTQHDVLPREVADNHLARGREVLTRQELVYFEDEIAGRYFQNYLVPVPASKHKGTFQIISRDITQNKQLQEYLRCMSYYDALTGLYNRNFFHEEMNRLKDGRYIPLGILICDINGLKRVNDTLGHEKGDELIQATGEILKSCFRESDILARIGGDEFAILLPHSDEDALRHARCRIISHVERYNSQARINDLSLSLSIGYAVEERQPPDLHDMFKRADDAMYQEKHKSVYSRC